MYQLTATLLCVCVLCKNCCYTVSQKSSHLLTDCNFVKISALLESIRNLLQNPYDITHLTLGMLLHYLWKLKIQIFCRCGKKANRLHF